MDQYLNEEQDPKVVEKLLGKLKDILTSGELITYIAVQKKPALTLLPDAIVATNKRIFLCEPAKLGFTTNFEILTWQDVKEVVFKEEIFGAKFTVIPQNGENLTVEFIPKVQARKLYQLASEALEKKREELRLPLDDRPTDATAIKPAEEPKLKLPDPAEEDEITSKLRKLKQLFEKQLITQEEYENKKNQLLSQL